MTEIGVSGVGSSRRWVGFYLGALGFVAGTLFHCIGAPYSARPKDVDGDGKQDIVVKTYIGHEYLLLQREENGEVIYRSPELDKKKVEGAGNAWHYDKLPGEVRH